ncbi:MAG TPA: DUF4184 family protein [Steroidobacteraceae bacterium]|nr:DUF4184 family protein [Steroidobacteraceae bacterium]
MPFTISHPAAVLPFARLLGRWRVLSALVIGSMVPDFGYLMPWRLPRFETHSAAALLSFSLPIGLTAYWIFQRLLKTPLREVLPDGAYAASLPFAPIAAIGSLRQWIIASGGVLTGAVTHLIWDGFTHEGARGVRMLPGLDEWFVDVGGHELAGPRFLEDLSSIAGLIVVGWVLWRLLRTRAPAELPPRRLQATQRRFWRAAYGLTALAVGICDVLLMRWAYARPLGIAAFVGLAAIASLRGLGVAVLGVSLCLDWRLRRRV